jgi:chromosome segregation ATPase
MYTNIKNEAKRDRTDNQARQEDCKLEIDGIVSNIRVASTSKADSAQAKTTKQGQLEQIVRDKAEKTQNKENFQGDLTALDKQRATQKKNFQDTINEFDRLHQTLVDARSLVQQLLNTGITNFLQETSTLPSQIQNKLNSFESNNSMADGLGKMASIAAGFLERSQYDDKLVQKVVDVIDLLIKKYEDLDQQARRKEVVDDATFQSRRTEFADLVYGLSSDVARLEAQSNELNQDVLKLGNDLDRYQRNIDQKTTEYNDTFQSCKDSDNEYKARRERRFGDPIVIRLK